MITSEYRGISAVTPPLWIVAAGFSHHGKTSLLNAMEATIQRLDSYLHNEGFYYTFPDNRTFVQSSLRKAKSEAGEDVGGTDSVSCRLLSLHRLGSIADRFISFWDVPGEKFDSLELVTRDVRVLGQATVLLVVSLNDLKSSAKGRTLTGLFQSVDAAIRQLDPIQRPRQNRDIVVVYTKSELCEFPQEIESYLSSDPLSQKLTDGTTSRPASLNLSEYVEAMQAQSERLREFTRLSVPNGAGLLNMADALNYRLSFAAVSDRMDAPLTNELGNRPRWSVRVIDPLLLLMLAERSYEARSEARFALLVDATADPGPIYSSSGLLAGVHAVLKQRGEVTVYYLGQTVPAARSSQPPPAGNSRFQRLRLAGPILDCLTEKDWRVLVLTNGTVTDLQDFRVEWSRRLRVVRFDTDAVAERWPNKHVYYESDTPGALVNEWIDALN
ncbi:MAG: hypothetical protein ACK5UC_20925 [Planctomycetaceae bacterium]